MATNFASGDISILGFNADGNFDGDDWSFMSNVWIQAGTTITFTDRGWDGTAFGGDGTYDLTMTWTAAADIVPGTVINFNSNSSQFSGDAFLDLWQGGDQILAYTGTDADPTFINGLHSTRDAWSADAADEVSSQTPQGLIDGADALALGNAGSSVAGLVYSGPTTGTIADLRTAWQDSANWTTNIGAGTQIASDFTVLDTTLTGTAGDDVLTVSADPNERITDQHNYDGLGGHDAVDYSSAINGVRLDLRTASGLNNEHAAYGDTYTSIEEFRLTNFADNFWGTGGADTVIGNDGNDTLRGRGGADIIEGGAGADIIRAGGGNDIVRGGDDNDNIRGQGGNDTIDGGAGADVILGNGGTDTVEHLTAAAAVTVDLTDATGASNAGDALGDTYNSIELWRLSNHDDTFIGDGNDNWVQGDAGRDALDGGGGIDTASYANAPSAVTVDLTDLTGNSNVGDALGDTFTSIEKFELSPHDDFFYGDGTDNWIAGLDGVDTLDGGGGIDILVGGAGADVLIGGGGPGDYASYETSTTGVVVDYSNTANNTGDAAGDSYTGVNHMIGSDFNDTLTGDAGFNVIKGGAGNDTINGGGGFDLLVGGLGADVLNGGASIDTASYDEATTGVTADLQVSANNTGEANGDTYIDIERLQGSDFDDTLRGDAGDNFIVGGEGDDTLQGRDGNDTFYGDAFGASGADDFFFAAADIGNGADIIRDFTDNVDGLVFSGITAGEISHVDQGANVELSYSGSSATILIENMNWADISDDISYI